jgi:membrane-associated phospholipid phosphatase
VQNDPAYRRLLWDTLIGLLLCTAVVALCYFLVDRPVAFAVHDNDVSQFTVLKWLTYPPPVVEAWVPAVLAVLMVRRACWPLRHWERALLAACISLVLAETFRHSLAFVFGRTWPETWVEDNPSLIRDGAYGFHLFRGGVRYASFPSGHTARTLGAAAVFWVACPRWRWACVLASVAVPVGLVGMDYHFVSDVIAGGFVGGVVGVWTASYCGLKNGTAAEPLP